jgi:hypothetical protein
VSGVYEGDEVRSPWMSSTSWRMFPDRGSVVQVEDGLNAPLTSSTSWPAKLYSIVDAMALSKATGSIVQIVACSFLVTDIVGGEI